MAVAAPLLVFLVVVTLHSDPGSHINAAFLAVVIAVVIAVAIILEGRARFEAANDFLVDLLVIGEKVNLPTLERLTEQAKTGSWHPLPER